MELNIDYSYYSDFIGSICDTKDLSGFKTNHHYNAILEHVAGHTGSEYLETIFSSTPITKSEVVAFCALNDSVGDPIKQEYHEDMLVSPTSLRYIFHAHLILTHMKKFSLVDIVEVGGGYGGLCLCLHFFAEKYGIRINSYRICDLPNILRLQKLYLKCLNPALDIEFVDARTYGENIECERELFLISNYCFSEIARSEQEQYRARLFPKVGHGFMAWNMIPIYDFGFGGEMVYETEYPLTGPHNLYVYF